MADTDWRSERAPTEVRRRGRPPVPEEKARSQRVVTFVTRDELEALKTMANGTGCTLSSAVYGLIRRGLKADKEIIHE